MNILIIRHGDAEPAVPPMDYQRDYQRALSTKGGDDIRALAKHLNTLNLGEVSILASPLKRTQETATLLADGLGAHSPDTVRELAPGASAKWLLNFIVDHETGGEPPETVVVVGHAPDVYEMVDYFCVSAELAHEQGFAPGTCAVVRFSTARPRATEGVLDQFVSPAMARTATS